jgi:hypothetical protein
MTPQIVSALCIKPRTQLTPPQAIVVDTLKETSPDFAALRQLAMRFRGILRGQDVDKLDVWRTDAHRSGVYGMQRFARTLRVISMRFATASQSRGVMVKPRDRSVG